MEIQYKKEPVLIVSTDILKQLHLHKFQNRGIPIFLEVFNDSPRKISWIFHVFMFSSYRLVSYFQSTGQNEATGRPRGDGAPHD